MFIESVAETNILVFFSFQKIDSKRVFHGNGYIFLPPPPSTLLFGFLESCTLLFSFYAKKSLGKSGEKNLEAFKKSSYFPKKNLEKHKF